MGEYAQEHPERYTNTLSLFYAARVCKIAINASTSVHLSLKTVSQHVGEEEDLHTFCVNVFPVT